MQGKKKRRRRGRYSFLLTVFVVFALVFSLIFTSGLFFKIKDIRVEGITVVGKEEIVSLSGISVGENIFFINKAAAFRSISAKIPYVKAVRVKRELPWTVVIIITEAAPAAMIAHEGRYWVFDSQGMLLESVPILGASGLPVVKGLALLDPVSGMRIYPSQDDLAKSEPLLELLRETQRLGIWEDVGEIDLTQLSNVCFLYKGRYRAELGIPEDCGRKIEFMLEALDSEEVSGYAGGTFYLAGAVGDNYVRFVPD